MVEPFFTKDDINKLINNIFRPAIKSSTTIRQLKNLEVGDHVLITDPMDMPFKYRDVVRVTKKKYQDIDYAYVYGKSVYTRSKQEILLNYTVWEEFDYDQSLEVLNLDFLNELKGSLITNAFDVQRSARSADLKERRNARLSNVERALINR